MWSLTPDSSECRVAPPNSSSVTISPVAAYTSGGPPKNTVPFLWTITTSSLIEGTYAPPAVQLPITIAIYGIPLADIPAWLKKILPK